MAEIRLSRSEEEKKRREYIDATLRREWAVVEEEEKNLTQLVEGEHESECNRDVTETEDEISVMEYAFENERRLLLFDSFSKHKLLPSDPHNWTDECYNEVNLMNFPLPDEKWSWKDSWHVCPVEGTQDQWEYAVNWPQCGVFGDQFTWGKFCDSMRMVRRRRWGRTRTAQKDHVPGRSSVTVFLRNVTTKMWVHPRGGVGKPNTLLVMHPSAPEERIRFTLSKNGILTHDASQLRVCAVLEDPVEGCNLELTSREASDRFLITASKQLVHAKSNMTVAVGDKVGKEDTRLILTRKREAQNFLEIVFHRFEHVSISSWEDHCSACNQVIRGYIQKRGVICTLCKIVFHHECCVLCSYNCPMNVYHESSRVSGAFPQMAAPALLPSNNSNASANAAPALQNSGVAQHSGAASSHSGIADHSKEACEAVVQQLKSRLAASVIPEHQLSATSEHQLSANPTHQLSVTPEHQLSANPTHHLSVTPEHQLSATSEHQLSANHTHQLSATPEHASPPNMASISETKTSPSSKPQTQIPTQASDPRSKMQIPTQALHQKLPPPDNKAAELAPRISDPNRRKSISPRPNWAAITIQKRYRKWIAAEKEKREKAARRRGFIINEIITTEKNYIHFLNILHASFYSAFLSVAHNEPHVLTVNDVNTIFSCHEVLKTTHMMLLQWFKEDPEYIGRPLVRIMDYLKPYREYVSNFKKSAQTLDSLMPKPEIVDILKLLETEENSERQTLRSLLIMPVNRLLKVKLLLIDLIKSTPKNHPDMPFMQDALKKLLSLLDSMNSSESELQAINAVVEISYSLIPCDPPLELVEPHRRLVQQAQFPISYGFARFPHILYLFNDILLVAQTKRIYYVEVLHIIQLFRVQDVYPAATDTSSTSFIIRWGTPEQRTVALTPATATERDEWIARIKETVAKNQKNRMSFMAPARIPSS